MRKQTVILTISLLIAASTVLLTTNLISSSYKVDAQQNTSNHVLVGGGNNTHPFYGYNPQQVETKVGSSIVWSAPTNAPFEPHTVTFVINPKTMAAPDAPFAVPSSTQFMPLPPGANSKPNIVPGGKNGMNTIIVSNAMSYLPASIDASGNAKTFPPNANLTLTGNEQYLNSGWILPKGGENIFPGSSNTFAVTFSKAGTYDYTCTLHPWMTGKVVVK